MPLNIFYSASKPPVEKETDLIFCHIKSRYKLCYDICKDDFYRYYFIVLHYGSTHHRLLFSIFIPSPSPAAVPDERMLCIIYYSHTKKAADFSPSLTLGRIYMGHLLLWNTGQRNVVYLMSRIIISTR